MDRKPIEDQHLLKHFNAISGDGIDRFLLSRGRFRLAILHGTLLVNQMRANHRLGILETVILGHAYMASALMATSLKGHERIGIQVRCDGPVQGLHVESTAHGEVRGYLNVAQIPLAVPPDSFDTAPFFGNGTLTVTRLQEGPDRQPYTGNIELVHGNLAEDLTRYFAVSEQTPTALALSVKFDRDGAAMGAGGLLLQALPLPEIGNQSTEDRYESVVRKIEDIVRDLPSLGTLFSEGQASTEIVRRHFADFDPVYVGSRPVEFSCDCDHDRFRMFIAALPETEIEELEEKGAFPLKVTCYNCASDYAFSKEELSHPSHA
jgi:molecular chaperone Hsp33